MRIVQIIPHFGLGGAETMCKHLSTQLKNLGHEVTIVSFYNKQTPNTEQLKNAGFDIVYLDKKQGLDVSTIFKLKRLFKEIKPDVIHTHLGALKYAFLASIGLGIKVVHTIHSVAQNECPRVDKALNKAFLKSNRLVMVALSKKIQETIQEVYSLNSENIPIVFNGAPLEKYTSKNSYNLHQPVSIAHVASFQPVKNHIELIKAVALLKSNNVECELFLYGDGEQRPQIEEFVRESNLTDNVHLCGFKSNVETFLTESDIFVLPSKYEGIPLSIIEAMGTGLPIVASDVGGIPDMITDGTDGLLCEPNCNSIAEKFALLIESKELRERCGKNSLKTAKRFSAEKMADEYLKVYK